MFYRLGSILLSMVGEKDWCQGWWWSVAAKGVGGEGRGIEGCRAAMGGDGFGVGVLTGVGVSG